MPKTNLTNMAGSIAIDAVPTCNPTDTAETVRVYIQKNAHSFISIDYIYVLVNHALTGVFSIHELMSEKGTSVVESFMTKEVAFVHALTDREHVAQLALAQSIKAVPVVDENGAFMGVVTADTVLQILNEEHIEDALKAAGIAGSVRRHHVDKSIFRQVITRTPWLIIGLFGGVMAAGIIEFFESIISKQIVIAAFIPAVVYMADAVGNQSEMLIIRALSKKHKSFKLSSYLGREIVIGLFVGIILAGTIFVLSYIWMQNMALSIVLSIAVVATVLFSICIAILLPWFFEKLKFDPAVASGPLVTVISDVSSVTIYLFIATALL